MANDKTTNLPIVVLTVSDSRSDKNDESGRYLVDGIIQAGHQLVEKVIVPDDIYQIRAKVSQWIADPQVSVIITNGGTGVTGRDGTPEAIKPLLDKTLDGFGELFRMISYEAIKASAMQSRALAGTVNGTIVFCLPGSLDACQMGWTKLICPQLDNTVMPCNLAKLIPRLSER